MTQKIIGFALCGIAGGLAAYFGGIGALTAVIIAELGMFLTFTSK